MPAGAWKHQRPLPQPLDTVPVCPIGQATITERAHYVAGREEARREQAVRDAALLAQWGRPR